MSSISAQQDVFSSLGLSRNDTQAAPEGDASKLGLETFLKLMVTQLNNQDPFKPMENGEFLGQIAQFGSVTGLDKLNAQMADLSTSLTSGQALQAGGMIGRQVLVPGSYAALQTGGSVDGQVELEDGITQVQMRVYTQAGQLVREMPLNASQDGTLKFKWDGLDEQGQAASAGIYEVRISGQLGDREVELNPEMHATVESVNLSALGGLTLNLSGLGPVPFNDVKQIF